MILDQKRRSAPIFTPEQRVEPVVRRHEADWIFLLPRKVIEHALGLRVGDTALEEVAQMHRGRGHLVREDLVGALGPGETAVVFALAIAPVGAEDAVGGVAAEFVEAHLAARRGQGDFECLIVCVHVVRESERGTLGFGIGWWLRPVWSDSIALGKRRAVVDIGARWLCYEIAE